MLTFLCRFETEGAQRQVREGEGGIIRKESMPTKTGAFCCIVR